MAAKLLIITNMGPSPLNPFQGQFVFRQAEAIIERGFFDLVDIYSMPALLQKLPVVIRYPVWTIVFVVCFGWRRYSHLHVHFFFPAALLARLYKKLYPTVRMVTTFHGTDVYRYQPPGREYLITLSKFDELIFVSSALRQRLSSCLDNKSTHVLSAGISDNFVPPETGVERDIDLLFVGWLDENKGCDMLLKILSAIQRPMVVAIVGTGPIENELKRSAPDQHSIEFMGALSEKRLCKLYQRSKFLINLSQNEAFGLVITEAMACGTPVIAMKTDGSLEQVISGFNGFFLPESTDEAVEIVQAAVSDKQAWGKLSSNSLILAEQHRITTVIEKLEKIYFSQSLPV